jgi:hypothetical protein
MTDRAEARRKYRAYLATQQGGVVEDEPEEEAPAVARARTAFARNPQGINRPAGQPAPAIAPGTRIGIFQAMKLAYRTPHYRQDVREVGTLIVHSYAVWPVALLSIGAAVLSATQLSGSRVDGNNIILAICTQFILSPLPLLPPMLAGFLAPKSTWLAGMIAGAISVTCYVALAVAYPGPFGLTSVPFLVLYSASLLQAVTFGAMFGALSGWYKRFLSMTSMSGAARTPAGSKQAQARGARR